MSMSYEENRKLNQEAEDKAREKFKTPNWVKEELSLEELCDQLKGIDWEEDTGPRVSIVAKYVGGFGPATGVTIEITIGDLKQEVSLAKGCSWHWYGDMG